jgi:hypothetical protein
MGRDKGYKRLILALVFMLWFLCSGFYIIWLSRFKLIGLIGTIAQLPSQFGPSDQPI